MSEIYFANLGIKNYHIDMDNARYRLFDFINYLYLARSSQQQKNYSLNWRILDDESIEEIIITKFIDFLFIFTSPLEEYI